MWDILNWAAYSVHPDAVAWLNVIVLLALFAVAFGNGRTLGAPALASGAAVFIAATGTHWFVSIRPLLLTILFVGVVMLTRDRKWAPFLWPVLVIVWVNLHGGFIFGIGAIGLLAVVRTVEVSLKQRRLVVDRRVWIGVALCLLVWMVNPWGWRIAGYPLDYLSDTGYREIGEWHAPDIGIDLRNYEGQFWIAALLAAAGAALSWKRDAYPAALCSVTFAMAATSRRFIPLFLVTSAPLVAMLLGEVQRRATQSVPWLRERSASIVAAIAFGLVPALHASRSNLRENLIESTGTTSSFAARRLLNGLVVVEVALALMLLVGAGLMTRSFARLLDVHPGFDPSNVVSAQVLLPQAAYRERYQFVQFFEDVIDRLRQAPGVESASAVSSLPMQPLGVARALPFSVEGQPPPPDEDPRADVIMVSQGYF